MLYVGCWHVIWELGLILGSLHCKQLAGLSGSCHGWGYMEIVSNHGVLATPRPSARLGSPTRIGKCTLPLQCEPTGIRQSRRQVQGGRLLTTLFSMYAATFFHSQRRPSFIQRKLRTKIAGCLLLDKRILSTSQVGVSRRVIRSRDVATFSGVSVLLSRATTCCFSLGARVMLKNVNLLVGFESDGRTQCGGRSHVKHFRFEHCSAKLFASIYMVRLTPSQGQPVRCA